VSIEVQRSNPASLPYFFSSLFFSSVTGMAVAALTHVASLRSPFAQVVLDGQFFIQPVTAPRAAHYAPMVAE
jgi:hypothetical protein